MTALLRAELARARARPFVWGVVLAVTLGAVGIVIIGWWDTRPPTSAQVEEARVELVAAERRWEDHAPAIVEVCEERQRLRAAQGGDAGWSCDDLEPTLERYLPDRLTLAELLDERLVSTAVMVVVGMLMTGVGLVTAEFTSGAMSTWLTFTPRRGRVLVTKLVAACAAAVVVAVVPAAVALAGLVAVSALNGTDTAVDGLLVASLAGRAARWLAVGLAATALGLGLAFAVRHAAAVTGIVVWWVAAVESTLPLVLPAAGWLPLSTNVQAVTAGVATYDVPGCVPDADEPGGELCEIVVHSVGAGQGALVVVVAVVLALGAGWVSFRFRDVP